MPAPEIIYQFANQEIESTDRAIDRLVHELSRKGMIYGLSEEEI